MQVFLHHTTEKYLDRLNQTDRERLKVSGYRVLYKIEDAVILATHIEPRGQAYKKKTKNRRG